MKYENYKAGYICDAIGRIVRTHQQELNKSSHQDQIKLAQINGLLRHASSFDVHFPYLHRPDFDLTHPILATINNIITRGLPTRAPLILEQEFQKLEFCKRDDKAYEYNFTNLKNAIEYQSIPFEGNRFRAAV